MTWNISCHSLLACSISMKKSPASLIRSQLYLTSCFSLAAFKILSLFFVFCHFNYDMSCKGSFWVPLDWDPLCFFHLCDFFSHQIKEVFHHYFFKQVFYPLLFSFSFCIPIIWILLCFMLTYISLNPFSFFLSLFSFSSFF